jgi:mannosylglycoprotein endo-beta-mannosidase
VGQEKLKTFITEYYKRLFGAPAPSFVSLSEEVTHDIAQLSNEEKYILTSPFMEEEVFEAISNMEHNKAPEPYGFPAEFYQKFWPVIKVDLMALFVQLKNGDLPLYKLNFGVITLLPKKEDASRIE